MRKIFLIGLALGTLFLSECYAQNVEDNKSTANSLGQSGTITVQISGIEKIEGRTFNNY